MVPIMQNKNSIYLMVLIGLPFIFGVTTLGYKLLQALHSKAVYTTGLPEDSTYYLLFAALMILALVTLFILFLVTRFLVFRYPTKTKWSFRWTGKTYRWLNCGWRAPLVRLLDVIIVLSVVNGLLVFAAESVSSETLEGLLLNESLYGDLVIEGGLAAEGPFNWALALVLTTLSRQWELILTLWLLFEIVRYLWGASQRLIIKEVVDYTGDFGQSSNPNKDEKEAKPQADQANRLADLLIVYLNRIGELYQVVGEERAIYTACGAGKPLDATIKTEDISEILKETASDINVGQVKLPTKAVATVLGSLMRGPRIIISLHKKDGEEGEEGRYFLTASMTGRDLSHSWRVDSAEPLRKADETKGWHDENSEKVRSLEDMIEELAHRIFASLTYQKTDKLLRWKASYKFSQGLRAYRDALVSTKTRHYNLKMAENWFTETLEEANDFALAYYNLGVVYTEVGQYEAAENAFLRAIRNNRLRKEAYYAQAMSLFCRAEARMEENLKIYGGFQSDKPDDSAVDQNEAKNYKMLNSLNCAPVQKTENACRKEKVLKMDYPRICVESLIEQYEEILRLCNRAIYINQKESWPRRKDYTGMAEAHNLQANAQKRLYQLNDADHLNKSIDNGKTAVKYAWMALFKAELLGENVKRAKKVVIECLIDIADFSLFKFAVRYDKAVNSSEPVDGTSVFRCIMDRIEARYPIKRKRSGWFKVKDDNEWIYVDFAEKCLKQALSIDPDDANLHFALGKAYRFSEKYDDATKEYERSVSIEPENSLFWSHLALARACAYLNYSDKTNNEDLKKKKKKKKKKKAISACNKVVTYGPGASHEALETVAKVYSMLKMHKSALRIRRAALKAELKEYLQKRENLGMKINGVAIGTCPDVSQHIFYIKCRLDVEENKKDSADDAIWRYAQFAIALKHLCDSEKDDYPECEEIDEIIKNAIYKLFYLSMESEHNEENCELEICQNLSARLLLYLKHNNTRLAELICNEIIKSSHRKYEDYKKNREEQKCGNPINRKQRYEISLREYSYILTEIGREYLCFGKSKNNTDCLKQAEKCFREAIKLLKIDCPKDIKRNSLNTLLAESLRHQGDDYQALKKSRRAQILNPLEQKENRVTGEVYSDLKMHNKALDELYAARSWDPNNPDLLVETGQCYMKRAIDYREKDERDKTLKRAQKLLEEAWDLYDKDDLGKRSAVRYYIGKIYMDLCEYDDAIPHLTVIYEAMRDKGKTDRNNPELLIIALKLGFAHLKNKNYNECERILGNTILESIHKTQVDINYIIRYGSTESMEAMALGRIIACACMGLAISYAERDVSLNRALYLVRVAKGYIDKIKPEEEEEEEEEERQRDEISMVRAFNADCEGWILYKQDLLLNEGTIDNAIESLKKSISIRAHPRTYLHLALACEHKSKEEINKKDTAARIESARTYCKHAKDTDIKGEYKKEIEELKQKLKEMAIRRTI